MVLTSLERLLSLQRRKCEALNWVFLRSETSSAVTSLVTVSGMPCIGYSRDCFASKYLICSDFEAASLGQILAVEKTHFDLEFFCATALAF